MELPSSLSIDISPPRALIRRKTLGGSSPASRANFRCDAEKDPTLAAVEAGRAKIEDHLAYFKHYLAKGSMVTSPEVPRLPIHELAILYEDNLHQHGHHFVIHQHNHPKAGVHYDLRLQFSATSSVSWAFPKGIPGSQNSRQLGRMAIETRVHNLWNNLIESASMKTGSLLIWETGTYTALPRKNDENEMPSPQTTDDESDRSDGDSFRMRDGKHENETLINAFKSRHTQLHLHGIRLPKDYTITLRLTPNNDISKRPAARRRRSRPLARSRRPSHTSDSDSAPSAPTALRRPSMVIIADQHEARDNIDTDTDEDAQTRTHNVYPGSTNSIGSIH
ncbi:uncharacterized protein M421DRAFT_110135 [Didymella exigua CBS 183.55]|uniref:DNA ligase D 3'-phosphoesterase domain-containing protein n=1 Tax=Didymella exigua CBS 183.55 TaxID=1150837 RepID=A0A6A5S1J5_9PLEO|nr:uncharacterized protein M421DRAFT_110135 [Didymella exigua CBS 183.55]KAF1933992.1 hypothetical protein M421DRAFT_110135 [Didymella exigua CBS 183.55]